VDGDGAPVQDGDGDAEDGHFRGTISKDHAYHAKLDSAYWGYNGPQVLVTDSSMTWAAAEAYAQSLGGHLATVNDQAEQDWLTTNFGGILAVARLYGPGHGGDVVWSSGQEVTYRNWRREQPSQRLQFRRRGVHGK